jgi:AraC-like DNA-binding protein
MPEGNQQLKEHYLDYIDPDRILISDALLIERHKPTQFAVPYHHHASVELNFPLECDLKYSFSGRAVLAPRNRLTVFWGAAPHCVTGVVGEGETINLYVSFSQLVEWNLPDKFVNALIAGDIIASSTAEQVDPMIFTRWHDEFQLENSALNSLLFGELQMRLQRLAYTGWECILPGNSQGEAMAKGRDQMRHVEHMLRYISDNYTSHISVPDIAAQAQLSPSYAMTLFRQVVGVPIKEYIVRIRLSHARMLLTSSDMKIVSIAMDCGFGSLSTFYEAFQARSMQTPAAFRRDSRD